MTSSGFSRAPFVEKGEEDDMNPLLLALVLSASQLPIEPSQFTAPRVLITLDPPTAYALANKIKGDGSKEVFRFGLQQVPVGVEAGFMGDDENPKRAFPYGEYVVDSRSDTVNESDAFGSYEMIHFGAKHKDKDRRIEIVCLANGKGIPQQFIASVGDGRKLARFLRGGMAIFVYPTLPENYLNIGARR